LTIASLAVSNIFRAHSLITDHDEVKYFTNLWSFLAIEREYVRQGWVLDLASVEIDRVHVQGLPLQNVSTGPHVVGCGIDSKNQTIVLVLKSRQNVIENYVRVLHPEMLLHIQVEVFELIVVTGRFALRQPRQSEPIFDITVSVSESICVGEGHEIIAVDDKSIEDKKERFLVSSLPWAWPRLCNHLVAN